MFTVQPAFLCIQDNKENEHPDNEVIDQIQVAFYETLFPEQS
jgi:hypothetical protein